MSSEFPDSQLPEGQGHRRDRLPVRTLVHRQTLTSDPLTLYRALAGDAEDTALLESLDATSGVPTHSFIMPRAAVRATCVGQSVTLDALTDAGESLLPHLAKRLDAGDVDLTLAETELRAVFPRAPGLASEEQRLHAKSVLEALRALAFSWRLDAEADEYRLLCPGIFSYDLIEVLEPSILEELNRDSNSTTPAAQSGMPADNGPHYQFWLPEQLVTIDHASKTLTAATFGFPGAELEAVGTAHGRLLAALSTMDAGWDRDSQETSREVSGDEKDPCEDAESHKSQSNTGEEHARQDKGLSVQVDMDDASFASRVVELKEHIAAGDVFQIVPSRTFSMPCPDPMAAYGRLRALNPSPYMFYVRGPQQLVFGASPETSVKVSHGRAHGATSEMVMEIRPIAGTARRGRRADGSIDPDLDNRLETALRLDEKELAEHMMLIDLARNDVARVCKPGTRHVPRILTVERYSHVMHLVSHVAGELRDDLDALHAYASSANMGTLVGAPKIRAASILHRIEATRRGPYGGAVGYLAHDGSMDSAIIIRSALVRDGVAHVRAGAGVVHDSDPESEAEETRRKAAAVLAALEPGGES